MPSRIRQLAEDITLADLLNNPAMASDALSVISNILNNSWMYADLQTPDDISLSVIYSRSHRPTATKPAILLSPTYGTAVN